MAHVHTIDRIRRRHNRRNILQSVLLLGGMLGLLAACAWLLVGAEGVLWVLLGGAIGLLLSPRVPAAAAMRWFGARRIPVHDLPAVYRAVDRLSARAALPASPALYYLPDGGLNSFAVGRREDSAIVLTDGMLRYLTLRETVAVIAHEISHIAGNDLWVMQLADTISRMTRMMSFVGVAIGLVSLPLMLLGRADMPWLAILLLVLAPGLASLLQMALSRTREFDADMEAATLTGDPAGLAMALGKIERIIRPLWQNIVLPHGRSGEPSLLRTHPATEERIARLRSLESFNNAAQGVEEPLSRVWPGAAPAGRRRLWW